MKLRLAVWGVALAIAAPVFALGGDCAGDCNDDGEITVDEIITGVSIGLGTLDISVCPRSDTGRDGHVTVEEILQAITGALGGCRSLTPRPSTTPAATPTARPTTPSSTPGAPSVVRRSAGIVYTSSTAFLSIPNLVSALIQAASANARDTHARGLLSVPFDCPAGGGGTLDCDQDVVVFPPSVGAPEYTVSFDACTVAPSDGRQLLVEGAVLLTGKRGQICGQIPDDLDIDIQSLTVTESTSSFTTVATFTDIDGTIAVAGESPDCGANQFDLHLSGNLVVVMKDSEGTVLGTLSVVLSQTELGLGVAAYGQQCAPSEYVLTVNGDATISAQGSSFVATYDDFRLHGSSSGTAFDLQITGALTSNCLGTRINLTTSPNLHLLEEEACPVSGSVAVTSTSANGRIDYHADGTLDLDRDGDSTIDETFPSCRDAALFVCPNG